jgi:cyanophycinase
MTSEFRCNRHHQTRCANDGSDVPVWECASCGLPNPAASRPRAGSVGGHEFAEPPIRLDPATSIPPAPIALQPAAARLPVIVNPGASRVARGLGVAGLCLGVLAFLACWAPPVRMAVTPAVYLGGWLGLAGLSMGLVSRRSGHGWAIAGLTANAVAFVGAIATMGPDAFWFPPRSLLARRSEVRPAEAGYRYCLLGNPGDVDPPTEPGMVLAGGGTDLDEAFRWMIGRSGGGDFLVIRTTGTDAYNSYVYDMTAPSGLRPDSVATLIIANRGASHDPFVLAKIREAEAIWIAGGDQAKHVGYWRDTPVSRAIDAAAAGGTPIGGTSSGLAVMGEFVYTAEADGTNAPHLMSRAVLSHPFHPRVTLRRDFLHLPHLAGIILEPHFLQESRHGRMATFLSRIIRDGWTREARGLGVERMSALLVEPDGQGRVIGAPGHPTASVSAFRMSGPAEVCEPGRALTTGEIEMVRIEPGGTLDLRSWATTRGRSSQFSVAGGEPAETPQSGGLLAGGE